MPEPVRQFFRAHVASREEAANLGLQLLSLAESPGGLAAMASPNRIVAFQPLMTKRSGDEAYLSLGAAKLLREQGSQVVIDPEPLDLASLPDGLGMVVGDNVDAMAYAGRHR